jgi:hypothetical protein
LSTREKGGERGHSTLGRGRGAAKYPRSGETEAEIYPGTGFLELEVQGPYTSIPAGGTLAWTVAWRIVKIPTSVTVSAGSNSLADFAKQQAAM